MPKFSVANDFSIPCEQIHRGGLRTRANFALWRDENGIFYSMNENGKKVTDFSRDFLCDEIKDFMQPFLDNLPQNFCEKLFEIRFFASSKTMLAVLIYHKDISELDAKIAQVATQKFTNLELKISLMARKQKQNYPNNFLHHSTLGNEYIFSDECFIQPSLKMNEKMLAFALECAKIRADGKGDLLELYCGYGNFTLALAKEFRAVFATELSKKNVEFLRINCELNGCDNLYTARLSDAEVVQALDGVRQFNRLKNINLTGFNFTHIMLDPPRAGLGECVQLAKRFQNIIYISCNPESAKKDLQILEQTHELKRFVLFDQFVNSTHLECGFYLEKRAK